MKTIVTFGEVMGRLAPEQFLRLQQVMPGKLELTFGGAEANVAVSVCVLGGSARYVSALPDNILGDACINCLRAFGVDTTHVLRRSSGRLGLYFLETGANQRPSNVIYDRANSTISLTGADQYDWDTIFADCHWLHVSGITPAISETAAEATLAALQHAKAKGMSVSYDLNFRKKLWTWQPGTPSRQLAEAITRKLLPYVDVVIANEEDAADVLSIHAENTDVDAGTLDISRYPAVASQIKAQFPNVSKVAITLRESISASHNNWGAMLYDAETETAYFAPCKDGNYQAYEIRAIVDRVGGGDSFAAGLIFALTDTGLADNQTAINFAVAASCLAHSHQGDFNYSTRKEVLALMQGSGSGRVIR